MSDTVLELYPQAGRQWALEGLYLQDNLREQTGLEQTTFVVANFITSLDGRIAIAREHGNGLTVPAHTANPRDWRLFQELAVQADVLITSGRYLRDYEAGDAQDILRVFDDPQLADLKDWRVDHGLKPYPDLALLSGSLDFPIPEDLVCGGRSVLVFTHARAHRERLQRIEKHTGEVLIAGESEVDGREFTRLLGSMGYRVIYSAAGPKVLHLLLAAGVLDRLYLTLAHRVLGGDPFSSIVEGPVLHPAIDFRLRAAFYDPHALDGSGQIFSSYDCVHST